MQIIFCTFRIKVGYIFMDFLGWLNTMIKTVVALPFMNEYLIQGKASHKFISELICDCFCALWCYIIIKILHLLKVLYNMFMSITVSDLILLFIIFWASIELNNYFN